MLLSAVTTGLVEDDLPAGVALLDLGRAPLKDFAREEHVFQLTLEGLECNFPPPRTVIDRRPFDGSEGILASRVSQRGSGAAVRLLGPVGAVRDGQLVEIGAAKQRMIMAMLALRPGQVVSTDTLIDALWGERPPATATKALQVYVSQLRDRVEPQRSTPTVVISHPPEYRLGIEAHQTDLGEFEQLWESGRSALQAGEASEAAAVLAEAVALWRGQPFGDLAYESAFEADAARLEEMRLAGADRVDADLRVGRQTALVPKSGADAGTPSARAASRPTHARALPLRPSGRCPCRLPGDPRGACRTTRDRSVALARAAGTPDPAAGFRARRAGRRGGGGSTSAATGTSRDGDLTGVPRCRRVARSRTAAGPGGLRPRARACTAAVAGEGR